MLCYQADCQTVWLKMSEDEQLLYGVHECVKGHGLSLDDEVRFRAAAHLYDEDIVTGASLAPKTWDSELGAYSETHSLASPSGSGAFARATAAFLRVCEEVEVKVKKKAGADEERAPVSKRAAAKAAIEGPVADDDGADADAKPRVEHLPRASCTKFAQLMADLKALRESEPDFRAVVFTRFDEVQRRLVALVKAEAKPGGALHDADAPRLAIFEFNKCAQRGPNSHPPGPRAAARLAPLRAQPPRGSRG
jgi:hypothetical protein